MSQNLKFTIPEPCHEDWGKMSAREKGRFCASCAKEVKDFSQSSPDEILKTIQESEATVCGRFKQNQIEKPSYSLLDLIPSMGNASRVAAASLALFSLEQGISQDRPMRMGKVAYRPEIPAQAQTQISGRVLGVLGEPLAEACVKIEDSQQTTHEVKTDKDGRFDFGTSPHMTQGQTVDLHISKTIYGETTREIVIREKLFVEIQMELEYYTLGIIAAEPDTILAVDPVLEKPEPFAVPAIIEYILIGEVEMEMGEVEIIECQLKLPMDTIADTPQTIRPELPEESHIEPEVPTVELPTYPKSSIADEPSLILYPNPVASMLTIQSSAPCRPDYIVFDQRGAEVLRGSLDADYSTQIDVSELAHGLYTMRLITLDHQALSKTFAVER